MPGENEDTEPTLDLSDELALVRAIQDIPVASSSGADAAPADPAPGEGIEVESTIAEVVQFNRASGPAAADEIDPDTELAEIETELDRLEAEERAGSGLETLYEILEEQDPQDESPAASEPDATS